MIDFVFSLEFLLMLFILLFIHELGHGIVAFAFGKFQGFSLHWWGATCNVKLPMAWNQYLLVASAGFMLSYIAMIIFMAFGIISRNNLWDWTVILGSIFDFLWIGMILLEKKNNPFFNEITNQTFLNFKINLVKGESR